MTLELLRNRWTYPVLVALRSDPLSPAQLLDRVNQGNARNADLVGSRILHEKTLFTTLHRMEAEGLIIRKAEAISGNGVAPWVLTSMSRGLLAALHRIAAWAGDHRDQLTATLRKHRGLSQGDTDLHHPKAAGPPPLSPEQDYWRGIGMTLVILRLRWGFTVISQLSRGPQHPTGITAEINAGIARNRDITGNRTLSEKVLWDTLHRLVHARLINHQPRAGQFASTARCSLTASGHALLGALTPIGHWAIEHEELLAGIIRRRRGLARQADPRETSDELTSHQISPVDRPPGRSSTVPDTTETSHDEDLFPFPPGPHGSPPAAYESRRRACPLAPVVLPSGDEVLLATTYDDVREVHSDPRFSRNLRYPGAPRMLPDSDLSDDPNALVNIDPPEHTRLRRIVQAAFTPRQAERWRPHIQTVADDLLAQIRAESPPVDLMATLAFPLPIRIICKLLGVPAEDSPLFRAWSDTFLSTSTASAAERSQAAAEFASYVDALIAARRKAPGQDLLDDLINAHDADDRLSEGELSRMVRGLIVAGHETTGNVIGRGILTLLRHPDQLALLRDDPSLLPGAVEEILRTEVPGHGGLLRVATEPVPLPSGGTVHPGQAVLAPVAAANLDPRYFPDPDTFNIRRTDTKHVAFGHGPHYCLGANLARVELHVAIGSVIRRFPGLALAGPGQELTWTSGSRVCSLSQLPVTW